MPDPILDLLDTPEALRIIYALGSLTLFFIGLYGLLSRRHLLKVLISLGIMELGVYLLLLGLVTSPGETAPILADGLTDLARGADPVPQALTLTALVIGMAVLALGVSLAVQYHRLTGNADVATMTALKDR
jgi:multisubunit Na+/H+ antiporter MnhC subunit